MYERQKTNLNMRGAFWHILQTFVGSLIIIVSAPEGFDLDGAVKRLRGIEGVKDLHHVHAWSLTAGRNVFCAHLCVPDPADTTRVLQEATDALRTHFDVYFSTLQVEQECLSEPHATDIDITRPQAPA